MIEIFMIVLIFAAFYYAAKMMATPIEERLPGDNSDGGFFDIRTPAHASEPPLVSTRSSGVGGHVTTTPNANAMVVMASLLSKPPRKYRCHAKMRSGAIVPAVATKVGNTLVAWPRWGGPALKNWKELSTTF